MESSRIRNLSLALCFLFVFMLIKVECITLTQRQNTDNVTVREAKRVELEMEALQKWKNAEKAIHKQTIKAIRNFLVFATGEQNSLNITQQCMNDIGYVTRGLATMKYWAYKMLDASSRLPTGILAGTVSNFGDFDGCLSIDQENRFKGRYCNVRFMPVKIDFDNVPDFNLAKYMDFRMPSNNDKFLKRFLGLIHPYYSYFLFRISVCVPSSCEPADLVTIMNKASEYAELYWESSVSDCTDVDDFKIPYNSYELISLIGLGSVAVIALIATLAETYLIYFSDDRNYKENSGIPIKILLCFSFVTNTKRLLKVDDNPGSISVFHGLKFFTILWVILNHSYNCVKPEFMGNAFVIRQYLTDLSFQVVVNGYPTVDTFFFISGVILVYGRMRMKDSAFSVPLYIFRRLWRLGPGILFLIMGFFTVARLGSGPIWKEYLEVQIDACKRNWWANLVFVNNFLKTEDQCMGWLWYVGADVQLYISALVVLIPIKRRPKLGLWILGICSVISVLCIIFNQLYFDLPPTVVLTGFRHPYDIFRMTENLYYPFYTHAITYCIGMATGYILYMKPTFRLPLWINITGWMTALAMGLAVQYGVWKWNVSTPATLAESLLYATGGKIGWSVALGWVIVMSVTGNGGFIAKFLSWKAFIPFSRMTYSTYLIHMFIQVWYFYSVKGTIETDHRVLAFIYMSFVVTAFMAAFIFTQLFEAPFMLLEKLVLPDRGRSEEIKVNGTTPDVDMMEKNNINHAFEHNEKGTYVQDTNKVNLEYKSELNSSSL